MKRIFFILLSILCITYNVFGQEPAQSIGNIKGATKVLGRVYIDSALFLPLKITGWSPLRFGAVAYDSTTNKILLWNGIAWNPATSGLDTIAGDLRYIKIQRTLDSLAAFRSANATKLNIADAASTYTTIARTLDSLVAVQARIQTKEPLLGFTPVTNARTITINGTSYDLSANRSWSVGTVTSVGITAGTGINVSGSPITSSGSITVTNSAPDQTVTLTNGGNITISGTYPNFTLTNGITNNNQLTNGAGYITSSSLSAYVPYTGATTNVNLGAFEITASVFNGQHQTYLTNVNTNYYLPLISSNGAADEYLYTSANTPRVNGLTGAMTLIGGLSGTSANLTGQLSLGYNNNLALGGGNFEYKIYRSSAGQLLTYFDDEYDTNNTELQFRFRTFGTPVNTLTLRADGTVGVNTTSTIAPLTVNTTSQNVALALNSSDGSRSPTIAFYNAGSLQAGWQLNNGNNAFDVFVGGGSTVGRIVSAGRWLINTTSDNGADILQVNGTIRTSAGFRSTASQTAAILNGGYYGNSGGDYHTMGYNIGFTGTGSQWTYAISDFSSFIRFHAGGFQFFTAPSGTVGNTMSATNVVSITQSGIIAASGFNQGGGTLNYNANFYTGGTNGSYVQVTNGSTGSGSANGLLVGLDGSGNAYINQQSNFDLYVRTNGTTRLTISAAGAATFSNSLKATGYLHAYRSTSTSTTLTGDDYYVLVTATATITLPTAAGRAGQRYFIKATSGTTSFATTSSQTIDGTSAGSFTLIGANYGYIVVVSDGSNWFTETYNCGC